MFRNNIFPISLLLSVIIVFYSLTHFFEQSPWLISAGTNVLQILIGTLSLVWLLQAYRRAGSRQKNFWLLLFVGFSVYLCSNWLWLYYQISRQTIESENLMNVLWMVAYLFFLAALIVKIRELSGAFSSQAYGFNIMVFMITVASISYHYLIDPVLEFAGDSLLVMLLTFAYPVADLTILFAVTILYYLIQKNDKQGILLLCITGFSFQVAADFIYAYLTFNGTYQAGHYVDLLWQLSILFIGLTAYYAKEGEGQNSWLVKNRVRDQAALFPYVSIVVLMVLVIESYQFDFNALSTGLLLVFLLLLGHQMQILHKNRQLVAQYKQLAYHDPLTGLRNRGSFKQEIESMLTDYPSSQLALLLLDLDKFKAVNDTLGHHIGDMVLMKTAQRLEAAGGNEALIFRLGGDEFIIIMPSATQERCTVLAKRIVDVFQDPMDIEGHVVSVTPSIGISKYPENGNTSDKLMQNADAAMYVTKGNGKNGFSFYDEDENWNEVRIKNENRVPV
ncbi:GGDEF domain-containing protein [Planococcus soli]|uniref:GGDEF domain-containing protein n=1 Tax=Planococcus soli TaxID=2666072 RepID=UPI00115D6FE8|nr:GGDEF domain-containing protein [Planococcus soli]